MKNKNQSDFFGVEKKMGKKRKKEKTKKKTTLLRGGKVRTRHQRQQEQRTLPEDFEEQLRQLDWQRRSGSTRQQERRLGELIEGSRHSRRARQQQQQQQQAVAMDDDEATEPESDLENVDQDFPATLRAAHIPHPAAAVDPTNSFYIFPVEAFSLLQSVGLPSAPDHLPCEELADLFEQVRNNGGVTSYTNDERRSDPDGFARNEIRRMFSVGSEKDITPYTDGGEELIIPGADVRDLPLYLMFFILYRLSTIPNGNSYMMNFSIDSSAIYPINRPNGGPVTINSRRVTMRDVKTIYLSILRNFVTHLPTAAGSMNDEYEITWKGGEDSGTRIRLLNYGQADPITLTINIIPLRGQRQGNIWTPSIQKVIEDNLGGCVLTVRNLHDNKCMLYCIVMGLLVKANGGRGLFGRNTTLVEDFEVYSKAMLYIKDSPLTSTIWKLGTCLFPPSYSEGTFPELVGFVNDLDSKVGTMMSIQGFREEFEKIEAMFLPEKNCGIDVYGIDCNINLHVYPLYISKNRDNVIDLLCITPKDSLYSHYCLITNLPQLMRQSGGKQFFSCSKCGACFYHRRLITDHQCPKRDMTTSSEGGYHFSWKYADKTCDMIVGSCSKCRLDFTDEFRFNYHREHCLMKGISGYRHVQLVTYDKKTHPELKGEEINMEDEDKHVMFRKVMYADFESSIDPNDGTHSFMSYGVYDSDIGIYKDGYSLDEFIKYLYDVIFNSEAQNLYVYFHNAMGYDANFILRHVLQSDFCKDWGVQVIMKSANRLQKLVFYAKKDDQSKTIHICDTFLFLTMSLEKIVASIRKDSIEENKRNFEWFFAEFHHRYPWVSEQDIDHILRKNIFPYRFFTSSNQLNVKKKDFLVIFEPREENLKYFGERVTLDDLHENYPDVKHVMDVFKCKDAKDYHDLYLCCDVLQLSDMFNRTMNILWESHHIHLTRYLGMPSASWAAFLRHDPKMRIPLYEDTFYAEFFKDMIRGGITSAALRYAKADDNHSIIYLDVNGLYPYVMQAYKFPCGIFSTVPMGWEGGLCSIKLHELFVKFEREQRGMCFCVDLHFPDEVKELTDMYPFAPEHRRIFKEYYQNFEEKELTPFLQKWAEANKDDNGKTETMKEFNGLVCTLYDKTKYNVHWRLLKFYMEHGVVVKKVWFGVAFDEGDYLSGYIRKNIEIRNGRKDELGKTVYKLLGNSIYGKTFESPFKRNTYLIVREKDKLQGLLEEGNIASMTPIDDLGWIVQLDGEDITLDKPTFIGACVCEFSKLHMYTLLYDKLMKIFPSVPGDKGCQLVYTDTDSFIVKVRHPAGVRTASELFAYIKQQDPNLIGGIGGQVKSETGEDTIDEVIALRAKVYAYRTKEGHFGKRAKGTTHDAQEMQLDWETYKTALESLKSIETKNVQFVRKTFKIASIDVYRQSLSVNDGKRYICDDGIHTHAFGYLPDYSGA